MYFAYLSKLGGMQTVCNFQLGFKTTSKYFLSKTTSVCKYHQYQLLEKKVMMSYVEIAAISDYYVLFDRDFLNIDQGLSAYFYHNNKTNLLESH